MMGSSLSACDQPRKGGFWVILQNPAEVNVLDALDVDTLKLHRLRRQRFGGVDSHLGADAVVGRRIELRALRARNDDEVTIGLETGRDGPFDFSFIIDIHVHIDDDDLLDVVMATERAHDDVLRFALALLVELDGEMVAAGAAAGETHIADGGETPLQVIEKRRLARNTAKQEVLDAATDNGMKNRILAMGDRIDLDHLAIGAWSVILRKLTERPLRLADLRQDTAFDHDLRMRGHAHAVGAALDHFDRTAEQRAGDFHFVAVERGDRLRSENAGRMHADHQRDLQTFAGLLSHPEIMQRVPGQQQDADTDGPADLAAVDRHVLDAGFRIACDQQRRRDVGATVEFVVFRDRQLLEQIDLLG